MLAPIVTKDMKLFPTTKPIPTSRIKNVRSRAQSLQDFANSNNTKQRVRVAPTQKRNAQSVGNLSLPNLSRSPPKPSAMNRQPLAAIAEGIEMPASSSNLTNVPASEPNVHTPQKIAKPRTVALDDLRIIAQKDFVDPTQTNSENTSAENSGAVSPTSAPGDKASPSASKRFISKLTSVFKSNKSNSKSMDDDAPTSPNSS